jgi:tRNA pseudouridine32 synthase / 23S rRNA pseudouridine746 synthase
VHMNGLGIPILGDDFFPEITEKPLDDFRRPLQLLASTLEFRDPFSGALRRFTTRRRLQAWTSYADWAHG